MTDASTIVAALEESFEAFETLGSALGPEEWEARSLCPDWTVRGVFEHVVGIESMLVAWTPDGADAPPPFSAAGAFAKEVRGIDSYAFMQHVRDVFTNRRSDLRLLDPSALSQPSWTPVGPGTYGRFMEIRIFDFWVHERDISTPLGRPTEDLGPRAHIALNEVVGSLGYIVGKKVGLPDGRSLVFHLSGPLERDIAVVVDGRARVVEDAPSPDVEVFTDMLTFFQLACGRVDPQAPIDLGSLSWRGDAELGERVARNLRFTM